MKTTLTQEIVERIRAADFGKDQLTEPIHEMLLGNMKGLPTTGVITTYESWFGRAWAIYMLADKLVITRINGANAGTIVP